MKKIIYLGLGITVLTCSWLALKQRDGGARSSMVGATKPDSNGTGNSLGEAGDTKVIGAAQEVGTRRETMSGALEASSSVQKPSQTAGLSSSGSGSASLRVDPQMVARSPFDEVIEAKIGLLADLLLLSPDQREQLRKRFEEQKMKVGLLGLDVATLDEYSLGIESILTEEQNEQYQVLKSDKMLERGIVFAQAATAAYAEKLNLSREQQSNVNSALVRWVHDRGMGKRDTSRIEAIAPYLTDTQLNELRRLEE